MYRSSGEDPNDNLASFLGLSGGGHHYRGGIGQDVYLETSTLHSGTPTSSLATSPPTTPMTPDPLQFGYPSDFTTSTQQKQHHGFFNVNTLFNNSMNSISGGGAGVPPVNNLGAIGTMPPQPYAMQQQQQHQQPQYFTRLQQQHNPVAQRNLSLVNVAANVSSGNPHLIHQQHHHQDEISHSLKMYAMFTAYKDSIENNTEQVDVMEDFASNGYTTDDVYFQQYQPPARNPLITSATIVGRNVNFFAAAAAQRQQLLLNLQTQSWLNLNFPETQNTSNVDQQQMQQQQHIWNNTTLVSQSPNSLSSPAAVPPPQGNVASNTSGGSSNLSSDPNMSVISASGGSGCSSGGGGGGGGGGGAVPKNTKRQLKDKYASVKHCVFCENNNEPEAVTKSHSVRDVLGRVLCPKLRTYICPICKASGDNAHTVKYCPKKPIITMEDAIKAQSFRLTKSGYYNKHMKV